MSAPSIKLLYFSGAGRAEIARLLFNAGGVAFTDVRLTGEEFAALKPTLPAGQLPVLEVDGKYFNQSKAIEMYAARKAGLYPADVDAALVVDLVRETVTDASNPMGAIIHGPADKREAAKEAYFGGPLPGYLNRLEGLIGETGTFIATLSYADISVFYFLEVLVGLNPEALALYPGLAALKQKVASQEKIAAYIATRP